MMLHGLDLFSGIGGISLALQPWVRTVCYVELVPYCQQVLRERIADGQLDDAPIWDDVRSFDPRPWRGLVDIVSGGFPCQDISTAGRGAGLAGEHSGLFWQLLRIVRTVEPAWVFLENTPGITHPARGGAPAIAALAALGFDGRWGVLGAAHVGAPHLRERWWCLAHRTADVDRIRPQQSISRTSGQALKHSGNGANGAASETTYADETGCEDKQRGGAFGDMARGRLPECGDRWPPEPDVVRVVHGPSKGLDGPARRIRAMGEGVVPACAREAFRRLLSGEGMT